MLHLLALTVIAKAIKLRRWRAFLAGLFFFSLATCTCEVPVFPLATWSSQGECGRASM